MRLRSKVILVTASTRGIGLAIVKETLIYSPAADAGSFASTFQFEKLEIHKVFLRFPNFNLCQNLSPSALAS